ncbi:MAG: serine/threonine-protein kinase [Myxococcales bacterium]
MNELPEQFGGKYRVVRSLARGGMGEVFLARHEGPGGFSRDVVVKTLLADLAEDEAVVSMFLAEARVAALLTHPNIVHLNDFGEQDGTYYIVLELLAGESLSAVLRGARKAGRKLAHGFVAAIGSQVCAGLAYAWTRPGPDGAPLHLVHRDISPQNILACTDGSAKILDFGIAKYSGSSAHTSPGDLKGKPSYLSPEHLGRSPMDGRSDLFCLGIVLWELVAGRQLFAGDLAQSVQRVAHEPAPELEQLDATVPPELSAIVARALRIKPDERFASAAEMGRALDAFLIRSGAVGADEIRQELAAFAAGRGTKSPAQAAPAPRLEPVTKIGAPDLPVPSWLVGETNPFATTPPVFTDPTPQLDFAPNPKSYEGPAPVFDTSAPLLDPEVCDVLPPARARAPLGTAAPPVALQPPPPVDEPLELARQPQPYPPPEPQPGSQPRRPPEPESKPRPASTVRPAAPGRPMTLLWLGGGASLALLLGLVGFLVLRAPPGEAARARAAAGKSKTAAELATTTLTVDSIPPAAAITLDGKATGQVTPAKLSVDTGREHTVELAHPDCFPFKSSFFAAPGEPSTVQASMRFGARVEVVSDSAGRTDLRRRRAWAHRAGQDRGAGSGQAPPRGPPLGARLRVDRDPGGRQRAVDVGAQARARRRRPSGQRAGGSEHRRRRSPDGAGHPGRGLGGGGQEARRQARRRGDAARRPAAVRGARGRRAPDGHGDARERRGGGAQVPARRLRGQRGRRREEAPQAPVTAVGRRRRRRAQGAGAGPAHRGAGGQGRTQPGRGGHPARGD